MKISKYVLLSTTVLGLLNPVISLADTNNSSNTSSSYSNKNLENKSSQLSESSDYSTSKQANKIDDNSNQQIDKKDGLNKSNQAADSQEIPWDQGLTLKLDSDGTLHLPAGEISDPSDLFYSLGEDNSNKVTNIVDDGDLKINGSMSGMFSSMDNATDIDLSKLDTSQVTDMSSMFANDISLTNLDVSNLDTSNVTDMKYMFRGKIAGGSMSLKNLDLSNFDTSNVTDMMGMFFKNNIENLDLSSFDTSNVTNMNVMFFNDTIYNLKLGSKTVINDTVKLYDPQKDYEYTGKWQTLGDGTEDNPSGDWVGSSADIYERSKNNVADTYVWQRIKAADVTVKYVDENGKNIIDPEVLSGNIGNKYTTEQKNITDYVFQKMEGNASGDFTDKAQTVTYVYKAITTNTPKKPIADGKLTVKYVDENGKEISKPVVTTKKAGTEYKTEKKDIQGYVFEKVEGNETGKYTADGQVVTYVYKTVSAEDETKPVADGKLTVKYVDENGKEISKPVVTTKKAGTEYKTEKKDIQGYVYEKTEGSETGKYTADDQTVTYIYKVVNAEDQTKPVVDGKLTVKYVDENGKEVSKPVVTTEKAGTKYKTDKKDIQGYVFEKVEGNETGKYTADGQTVTYVYKTVSAEDETKPVADGKLTVKYVDENGKEISKSVVTTEKAGTEYKTEKKDIQGYVFEKVEGKEIGKYTADDQSVTYVYKAVKAEDQTKPVADGKLTVKYVDENGKEISKPVVTTKKAGTEYKTEKKDIQGYVYEKTEGSETGKYTADGQTVTYVYKAVNAEDQTKPVADGKLTVKYVDENGKEISNPVVTTEKAGTEYKTEKKDITGYVYEKTEGSETGKYTADGQTVTYVYKAIGTNTPTKPVVPTDPSKPVNPTDPDTPNNSGNDNNSGVNDNNSGTNNSNTSDNNSPINNAVNNVVNGAQTLLPNTSAEKVTFAGIVGAVLASLAGLVIWKKRK
ncbi:MucBP domain-containing protein [Weissella koreensis]|uniref:BspA family leucine-rich repeat surface protein n=4 Tax=Bacilli TaxID=91061 RepID=A0A7H1MLT7_9LACO|nr:MucBP domain-containing protein [Weissella koreensis]AVH75219.1 hypothetical protein C4597_03885 [Weissella koreensis]QGN20444.1 BspA family leucine-rich repeat surface protein [Weissella koreensis]QNT64423.1 BspA family leucine-rich repeat surface protein [Weissella koreensis]